MSNGTKFAAHRRRYGWYAVLAAAFFSLVTAVTPVQAAEEGAAKDPHAEAFDKEQFPRASTCAACHQQIYDEWSYSNHAYASLSPMFHKFEQTITDLSSGTIGTFCVRCHAQVSTQVGEPREMPMWERSQVSREGITCITCHRVNSEYYKVNGERRINPAPLNSPVYSSKRDSKFAEVVGEKEKYAISTDPKERGNLIHTDVIQFDQIKKSEFCVGCHQVAVQPGIKLEVVWDQYRDSPAHRNGVPCQNCHMGKDPGLNNGFEKAPTAVVSGTEINPGSDHHNHAFYGPGYPVAHPGIFPHNPKAEKWSMSDWLKFNYRSKWGVSDWEDEVEEGTVTAEFPEVWSDRFDREEAREIIDENLEKLQRKKKERIQVMENGSRVDGPFFSSAPQVGNSWKFSYKITNTDDGHNLPSGSLGAQPEIWVNVALTDPDGKIVFESGYVDSNGDMADLHSLDLAAGKIEHDDQLVNFQTKFLTNNVKGTDREMYLPVNLDIDQRPFLRPANFPASVLNHPPFIRMEGRSIPPLGHRDAEYKVPASALTKPGKYKLAFRMRSRAEPVYFMRFVGATKDMERGMNEWMIDIHPYTVEIDVK